jgi:hypothetical protein
MGGQMPQRPAPTAEYFELRSAAGVLIGAFASRNTALRVAAQVLRDGDPHVLLQSFDEQGQLRAEEILSRRDARQLRRSP